MATPASHIISQDPRNKGLSFQLNTNVYYGKYTFFFGRIANDNRNNETPYFKPSFNFSNQHSTVWNSEQLLLHPPTPSSLDDLHHLRK
jgi:hypothetical protein